MSDEIIKSLNAELGRVRQELATANAEAKERRIKGKKIQADLDALTTAHATVVQERDDLKTRSTAAPAEKDLRIAALESQVRTRDHRDAFASVKEVKAKVKDDRGVEQEKTYTLAPNVPIEDVWAKAQYKAEGDTVPDALKIAESLGKALAAAPYLFRETVPGRDTKPELRTELPGGRGAPDHDGSRFVVRTADLNDADFMHRNQKRLAEASEAGLLQLID